MCESKRGALRMHDLFGFVAVCMVVVAGLCSSCAANSGPVVIEGRQNVRLTGLSISNPGGTCLLIKDKSTNIVIENSQLGPCGDHGIHIIGGSNITIRNNFIHDTSGNGVAIQFSDGVQVAGNRIENTATGVYAYESRVISVGRNTFKNVRGPVPAGSFVQFSRVTGGGNRVTCNMGENVAGQSNAEDAISMYVSHGLPSDPIEIIGNKIKGGGPSLSGGGINLGDSGGSYQTAKQNVLVNPGQYGIAISGGSHMQVIQNVIYAAKQPFSNVGISAWQANKMVLCAAVTVSENTIDWTNARGHKTPSWSNGQCGWIDWSTNRYHSALDPGIVRRDIAACAK